MAPVRVVTGKGSSGLDLVVRHLWEPLIDSGQARIVVGPQEAPGWHPLHSFVAVPSSRRPRLLVTKGDPRAVRRALGSHAGLRSTAARLGRTIGGAAATSRRSWSSSHGVTVQVRSPDASHAEPLTRMEDLLGQTLLAVLGVRRGANAKATLQLFDTRGSALGYAKVGWSPLTAGYVRTETALLCAGPTVGPGVRTPSVLAQGDLGQQRPFLVTRPMPQSARRLTRADHLSIRTLTTLFPVVRHDAARDTGQYRAVRARLAVAQGSATSDEELHEATVGLARDIEDVDVTVPVLERWHGDLVPWNCARDTDGTIWLWDWESSEADAVVGLDPLHWLLNADRRRRAGEEASGLRVAAGRSATLLQALGMSPLQGGVVAAVYALTKAERYWTLAAAHGSWERNRIGRNATLEIIATGRSLLAGGQTTKR